MSKYYRYNGVKLPALPKDVVDKYPYIVILFEHDRGYGSFYSFHASTEPSELEKIWYSADNAYQTELLQRGKGVSYYIKKDQSDIWTRLHDEVDGSESASAPYWYSDVLVNSLGVLLNSVVWTNHNIYNIDGGIEYTANDAPTPIPDIDLKSWLTGYALGLAGKPMPLGVPRPTAYLYNGTKLPPLPEWDDEVYPYVVLDWTAGLNTIWFYAVSEQKHLTRMGSNGEYYIAADGGETFLSCTFRPLYMDAFPVPREKTYTKEFMLTNTPHWANYDVKNTDGSIHTAASEPVPVYE